VSAIAADGPPDRRPRWRGPPPRRRHPLHSELSWPHRFTGDL